jgi:hypothetical protein
VPMASRAVPVAPLNVEHEDRFPLLAFGGVDSRKDQIVLVEQRYSRLITGGIRRIKRQFGKEPFAGGITGSDLFELDQIRASDDGIFMDTIEVRFVPEIPADRAVLPPDRWLADSCRLALRRAAAY